MINSTMIQKVQLLFESTLLFLSISWNAFFGSVSAIIAAWYYLAMFKINVINPYYGGSWKEYIKQKLKIK